MPPPPDQHLSLKAYLRTLFGFARGRLIAAGGLMLVMALTSGIGLLMLVPLLGLVGLGGDALEDNALISGIAGGFDDMGLPFNLAVVLVIFLALITIHALVNRYTDLLTTRVELEFTDCLRNRLYRAIAWADWLFLSRMRSSEFTHALTSDVDRVGTGTYYVLQLATTATLVTAYLAVAFRLYWALSTIILVTAVALVLVLRPFTRRALGLGQDLTDTSEAVYKAIGEHLGGMKVVKAFGAEDRHVRHLERCNAGQREQQLAFMRNHTAVRLAFRLGTAVALALFVYIAVEVLAMPAPELLVLIFVFSRIMPMLSTLHTGYQQILHMLPAFASLEAMRAQCEAAAERQVTDDTLRLQREVRFDRVGFRYLKDAPGAGDVLKGITLEIPAHTTTAITGPSGAGKSTIADLLMGLLHPDSGQILIDGRPLTRELSHAWRRHIAYVPQETFLFHDTVRANLLWAQPDADGAALWHALALAAADDFVRALPGGLDTVVGERGVRLSGGERQRIALARALLRWPDLLILDEATSALDTGHERRIQQAIDDLHGRLTVVIIAHRLSTIRHADTIVVLENGQVTDTGNWEQLSERQHGRLATFAREPAAQGR